MKALRFALVALSRDWRSGELAVLLAALVVAVAALTGVGFFTDRVGQAVAQQAAEVIAADLRLQASNPPSDDYGAAARAKGLETARTLSFPTVVFFGEASTLAAIRDEFGWHWAALSGVYQFGIAWLLAVVIFQVGTFLGYA